MLSKKEASVLKQNFWTKYGLLMNFVPSVWSPKVNWVNYKTGVKHVRFKMDATAKNGIIGIELSHPDETIRALFFEQLQEFKFLLEQELEEQWVWEFNYRSESDQTVAYVFTVLNEKSVFRANDWHDLFVFFKKRIVALDAFWEDAQYTFKDLSS